MRAENKEYFTTHIQFTLYVKDDIDRKLYERLCRKVGYNFKKKTFNKNTIDQVLQEPDFYNLFKHFKKARNQEETIERVNTVSFLFVACNLFERLKKITFVPSNRKDTQKVFRDGEQVFTFAYSTKGMKVDLRRGFVPEVTMNQEVAIQESIQEFKKFLRNGYYDEDMMSHMTPQRKLHQRAVKLYVMLTNLPDEVHERFEQLIDGMFAVLDSQQVINSNPIVLIE